MILLIFLAVISSVTGLKIEATAEKVKENENVTLMCGMNCSLDKSNFSWFRNGKRLERTSQKLEIKRATYEDDGSYSCQTGNVTSPAFLLNVEYAPKNVVIAGQPSSACTEDVKSVALYCKALANRPDKNTEVESREQRSISPAEATNVHEIATSSAVKPEVNDAPKNTANTDQSAASIEEGKSVMINCKALANPPSNYTWFKNNTGQIGSGEQLNINKFDVSHAGTYYCEAKNIYGTAKSPALDLKVKGLSDWGAKYEPMTVCALEGSTVRINCIYWHPSQDTVKKEMWLFAQEEKETIKGQEKTVYCTSKSIMSNSHTQRVQFFGNKNRICSVEISNMRREDSGFYKFRVEGTNNWTQVPGVQVTVTDVSEWGATYETMRICALKGSTVKINCTYRHPECVTVENQMWFYSPEKNNKFNVLQTTVYHTNEQKVSSSYRNRVQFLGNKTTKCCSVEISNVSREDSGFYAFRFEGTNNWTQVPGVELTVTDLKVEATAEKVKENDTVTLTCRMNCSLNSSIFNWFKNGQLLNESSEKLNIQNASAKDHGSYRCQTGNISSAELQLNVEYAPKNVVITGHPNSSVAEGDSVILNCTASANPTCNYSWVKENTSHVGSGEQLHINEFNKSHVGSYHCEATNIHGTTRSAAVNLVVNENMKHSLKISMKFAYYFLFNTIVLIGLLLSLLTVLRKWAKKTEQRHGDKENVKNPAYEDRPAIKDEPSQPKEDKDEQNLNYASLQFKMDPNQRIQNNGQYKKAEDSSGEVIYSSIVLK